MADSHLERWGAASLLAVCLLIGTPVLLAQLAGDRPTIGPPWLWWCCYLGFLGLLTLTFRDDVPRGAPLPVAVAVAGAATVLTAPRAGWTSILLVFVAGLAAHLASRRVTVAVVAANSAVAATAAVLLDGTFAEVALTGLIYGTLQVCTVWAVRSEQRETAARRRLAVANAELRATSALLAESSRAGERLRIARELHDLLGHQLTALALELEVAAHRSEPPARAHVERARGLAKELLGDVRTAVGELRAGTPDLGRALAAIVADLPRPRVHLDVDAAVDADEACTAALIRCVQEAVTNTIRHGDAENLWIEVGRSGTGEIVLTARDDGRGASVLRLGHGLTGVRERIGQLGGTVAFDTRSGFTLSARVPAP
ncbi:sensor histidine kinase [Actinomadura rugatobispora]|uniref:Sensor histidine kinase n=1 Tax=Actinomadura rugatobispora TaxID=1994 RepID=A0ABW0ZZT0_9ACTN